ncbi:MFS transporter [Kordiimonas marina]|uniref:MFS transporter n=1 Tax=Kordiimonas marina TaxID=2872312 RepID=UPI001FF1EAD6|nr:MFS transporter [Kordiimonas marina]MCJ9428479.1 MFS transporter [Kordiimonas marina]
MSPETTPDRPSLPEGHPGHTRAIIACATVISGTVLGLSGIDLVLPAVPSMPAIFGTDIATSQLVLAAYVAGTAVGLLLFGVLAGHFGRRRLFIASLAGFGIVSLAAAMTDNIWELIALRVLQGAIGSGPAVLAPGLIRNLFDEIGTVRAISAMGSIESLVPGFAPILGAWLFVAHGWQASFTVTGTATLVVVAIVALIPHLLPHIGTKSSHQMSGYRALAGNPTFLRYAVSHALVLGGLLTFVFSAPAVIITTMGGTISDFILMQAIGVGTFVVTANMSGTLVKRFGIETVITAGTAIATFGALALALYGAFGPNNPHHLAYLFWILNTGLGVRGGPGFVRAIAAGGGDDDRASALAILAIMGVSSGCTALVAPLIPYGLAAVTGAILLIVAPALLLIIRLKPLEDNPPA